MKIGILTYHTACNFGANLQVLSTYNYIKNTGNEAIVINWYTSQLERSYRHRVSDNQYECHEKFRQTHLLMTSRCFTSKDVACVIEKEGIDAVIIGSDAVARYIPKLSRIIFPCRKLFTIIKPTLDCDCPSPFWGEFNSYLKSPVPVAMMSVSNQSSNYISLIRSEKKLLTECLQKMSYVSTRDLWTQKTFRFFSNNAINPSITPDPVFAFNYNVIKQPTETEIRNKYGIHMPYVVFGFLNSKTVSMSWLKEIKDYYHSKGILCVALPFPEGKFVHPFEYEIKRPLDPIDWYSIIKYSNAYIGHNMHPSVICLHNQIPCFIFDYYATREFRFVVNEKSSKIKHIMDFFEVGENRISTAKWGYKEPKVSDVIDKLSKFDIAKVKCHAESYLENYKNMMTQILEGFKNQLENK